MTIDENPEVGKPCLFERCMYLSLFYCLCYVKDISTDMPEKHILEEIYTDLNEEEDLIMEDIREDHWRYFSDYGEYKKNIHALRW